jgi:hypothetical protein
MPSCLTPPVDEPANSTALDVARPASRTPAWSMTIICAIAGGLAWLYAILDTIGLFVHELSDESAFLVIGFAATASAYAFVGFTRWTHQRESASEYRMVLTKIEELSATVDARYADLARLIEGASDYFEGYTDGFNKGYSSAPLDDEDVEDSPPPPVVPFMRTNGSNGFTYANGHSHKN